MPLVETLNPSTAPNPDAWVPSASERAHENRAKAENSLDAFRAAAGRWPEMQAYADAVAPLLERADEFDAKAEIAAAETVRKRRERDSAARVAIRQGKDPEAAEKAASDALKAAEGDAEKFARYFHDAARLAAVEADKGFKRLRELRQQAAPEFLHATLRELHAARREAVEAAADAKRKLSRVAALAGTVRVRAKEAGNEGVAELARLAQDPTFDSTAVRFKSGRMSFEEMLRVIDEFEYRISYAGAEPYTLGTNLGAAVRYALAADDAESADAAAREEKAAHRERVKAGEIPDRPFFPRPASDDPGGK